MMLANYIHKLMKDVVKASARQAKTHLRDRVQVCRDVDVQFVREEMEQRLPFRDSVGFFFGEIDPREPLDTP